LVPQRCAAKPHDRIGDVGIQARQADVATSTGAIPSAPGCGDNTGARLEDLAATKGEAESAASGNALAIHVALATPKTDLDVGQVDTKSASAITVSNAILAGQFGANGFPAEEPQGDGPHLFQATGIALSNAVAVRFTSALRFGDCAYEASSLIALLGGAGVGVDAVNILDAILRFELTLEVDANIFGDGVIIVAIIVTGAAERIRGNPVFALMGRGAGVDSARVPIIAVGVEDAVDSGVSADSLDAEVAGHGIPVITLGWVGAAIWDGGQDAGEFHAGCCFARARGFAIICRQAAPLQGGMDVLAFAFLACVLSTGIFVVTSTVIFTVDGTIDALADAAVA
jgi:hypothetical protein